MKKKDFILKKFLLLLLSFTVLLLASCAYFDGDNRTGNYVVKGTVLDENGNALEGVQIYVKDLPSISTTTDSNGNYELSGLGRVSVELKASKTNFIFVPNFTATQDYSVSEISSGSNIYIAKAAKKGVVSGADFLGTDKLKISHIQGSSLESPLKGETVYAVKGVVTMVCHRAPHFKYDTTDYDGSTVPQWLSYDGFFMEALPEDKDLSGKKSNGIFVNTHDPNYDDTETSYWKEGIPTDLQAGDVVYVTGVVEEERHLDRYGAAAGVLTRTEINATAVNRSITSTGDPETASYPDGVLLTYSSLKRDDWLNGHESDGLREARILAVDSDDKTPMKDAIEVLESVESMVIRIENPLVVGQTYYNLTGILADGGKTPDNANAINGYPRTYNENWNADVIWENSKTGVQDFNEELLFVDYQAVDWTTNYAIPQPGDYLVDSTSTRVFRGIMDYSVDGLYMAHPLNTVATSYITGATASNYTTPYYTRSDNAAITSVTSVTIPNQGWSFSTTDAWYNKSSTLSSVASSMSASGNAQANTVNNSARSVVKAQRLGSKSSSAHSIFTPSWTYSAGTDDLTIAAFNLENYEAQGSSYDKQGDIALIIKNNLQYPDVVIIVEMGDDKASTIYYNNQDNAWAPKDGSVTAVRNFSGISDAIVANGGPRYDFRCIDPREGDFGGKGGVNIRAGIMYNTDRIEAVDSGLVTNTYLNTHGGSYSGSLLDEDLWPVQTSNNNIQGVTLATTSTAAYKGSDGKVHLSQSPSLIDSSYFSGSRRPIICEFKRKDTNQNFFVMGCHLSSKRGDYPLYGSVQPPLLISEVKRDGQAQTINNFVNTILALDSQAFVAVGGDMNDFAYSTPQRILKGELGDSRTQILWSLAEEIMPYQEQFSYYYRGNYQQIDHIFISDSLMQKAYSAGAEKLSGDDKFDYKNKTAWKNYCFIPHVNSMFSRNNKLNTSDHDPEVIKIPNAFN